MTNPTTTHTTTTTTTTTTISSNKTSDNAKSLRSKLEFHGAAASSSPHSLIYLPVSRTVVYASNCMVNLARRVPLRLENGATEGGDGGKGRKRRARRDGGGDGVVGGGDGAAIVSDDESEYDEYDEDGSDESDEDVAKADESRCSLQHVDETLRTRTIPRSDGNRCITAMALLKGEGDGATSRDASQDRTIILCAFSDGTLTLWSAANGESAEGSNRTAWKEDIVRGQTLPPPSRGKGGRGREDTNGGEEEEGTVSITDVDGAYRRSPDGSTDVLIVASSSYGVDSYSHAISHAAKESASTADDDGGITAVGGRIANYPGCAVCLHPVSIANAGQMLLACGTATPRSNRVHLYTASTHASPPSPSALSVEWRYQGSVLGHLDWVTCLSFLDLHEGGWMLASGSQDARIRLWRIHPPAPVDDDGVVDGAVDASTAAQQQLFLQQKDDSEEEEENDDDEDDDEDGDAARMHLRFSCGVGGLYESGVTLEALLIGHEEMITAVRWRPQSSTPCLVSSSMDRSILLWTEEVATEPADDTEPAAADAGAGTGTGTGGASMNTGLGNVWVPITRVGTAGGILGGSIGSSLLGFVNVVWNGDGTSIVGHGYGGSVHLWSCKAEDTRQEDVVEVERWRAEPCLTGHFRGVTDIDWEITSGRYLLSVGMDQTCRLWSLLPLTPVLTSHHRSPTDAPPPSRIWREIARPQVHGYDLTSIACIDTSHRKYRFVSGAEEKEGRIFEAPLSTIRLLNTLDRYTTTSSSTPESSSSSHDATTFEYDDGSRVERAYIPSLGLSNRATAADAMEEGDGDTLVRTCPGASASAGTVMDPVAGGRTAVAASLSVEGLIDTLPTERDLGVTTLWPELRKLFGHYTELISLTSVVITKDNLEHGEIEEVDKTKEVVLVASSCKARDMEHASIRVWDVHRGMCVDVLKEGHKSTVVALSFSPDGTFLASAGKDRRLCIWRRRRSPISEKSSSSSNIAGYDLVAIVESAHKRIIWSVDFYRASSSSSPPASSLLLATGSRDGFVKLWRITEQYPTDTTTTTNPDSGVAIEVKELSKFQPACQTGKKVHPITAVAFAPRPLYIPTVTDDPSASGKDKLRYNAVLALGTEEGFIEFWGMPIDHHHGTYDEHGGLPELLHAVPQMDCHIGAVQKLKWRPVVDMNKHENAAEEGGRGSQSSSASNDGEFDLTLASCSLDHGVRILHVSTV